MTAHRSELTCQCIARKIGCGANHTCRFAERLWRITLVGDIGIDECHTSADVQPAAKLPRFSARQEIGVGCDDPSGIRGVIRLFRLVFVQASYLDRRLHKIKGVQNLRCQIHVIEKNLNARSAHRCAASGMRGIGRRPHVAASASYLFLRRTAWRGLVTPDYGDAAMARSPVGRMGTWRTRRREPCRRRGLRR